MWGRPAEEDAGGRLAKGGPLRWRHNATCLFCCHLLLTCPACSYGAPSQSAELGSSRLRRKDQTVPFSLDDERPAGPNDFIVKTGQILARRHDGYFSMAHHVQVRSFVCICRAKPSMTGSPRRISRPVANIGKSTVPTTRHDDRCMAADERCAVRSRHDALVSQFLFR